MLPIHKLANTDGALARSAADRGIADIRMGARGQFLFIGEEIVVRIPGGAILRIARPPVGKVVRTIIERIQTVVLFPAVGKGVAVGVADEGIGLGDFQFRPAVGLSGAGRIGGGLIGSKQKGVVYGSRVGIRASPEL